MSEFINFENDEIIPEGFKKTYHSESILIYIDDDTYLTLPVCRVESLQFKLSKTIQLLHHINSKIMGD